MIGYATTHRIIGMILKQAERRSFAPLVGSAAFLSTLSMSVPVEWLVVVATLACRRRWAITASVAALGSAIASLGLYLAFHHFGWNILLERYPDLAGSRAWLQATDWLSRYGLLALFGVMAVPLPIPKLPMLAVAGIYRLPIPDVFVAIVAGKIIKYLAYAYITIRFPRALRSLTGQTMPLSHPRSHRLQTLVIAGLAMSRKVGFRSSSTITQKDAARNGGNNVG
jgi:membrane protein YqaA with SNARE-associated domain